MIKYILFTFTLSVLQAFVCMGQQNQLKGPAAKNHKVWNNSPAPLRVTLTAGKSLKGPQAKNLKPWQSEIIYRPMAMMEPRELMGPKAKNMHHFKPREINQVQVSKVN